MTTSTRNQNAVSRRAVFSALFVVAVMSGSCGGRTVEEDFDRVELGGGGGSGGEAGSSERESSGGRQGEGGDQVEQVVEAVCSSLPADSCVGCLCQSCGVVAVECAMSEPCLAVLQCMVTSGCRGMLDCLAQQECESAIDALASTPESLLLVSGAMACQNASSCPCDTIFPVASPPER